jgi:TolB protein
MFAKKILLIILVFISAMPALHTQEQPPIVIHPRASEDIILAVADVQQTASDKPEELADMVKIFNQVLWDDLKFSGFFTLAGKSFYPPQPIIRPEDVNYDSWSTLPFKVSFLAAGTLSFSGANLRAELRLFDMKQRTMSFGRLRSGSSDQIRTLAHQWADEIVYKLTAGASRGIASTKIAYSSRRGNAKEIYIMDYDGYNQRAFTHNGANNLFPNFAQDNSKLAFVSNSTGKNEINIYSYLDGSRLAFPQFNSFASTPALSPDGKLILFSLRTSRGDTDLYISELDGSNSHNITNNPAIDTSPTWSPSGKQIAFVSDRIGRVNQIFISDVDGSNVRGIIKEGGDADSPAWSPDGRLLAFHWKPHMSNNYDLFLAEVSSGKIFQLTSNGGSNENPSWAPDGRHLCFQSNRSGRYQICIMLVDGSELRMVTSQGINRSPSWGGYFSKEPGD